MSRTDAHGPFWSWLNDPAARKEVHDHRNGPCDLPSVQDQLRKDGGALRRTRCRWEVDHTRVPPLCGCRMCTEHEWRRGERRRERHETKRRLRNYLDDE